MEYIYGKKGFWLLCVFFSVLLGVSILPRTSQAERFEISAGFFYNRSNYRDSDYSWSKRWSASVGINITDITQLEFSFQDVVDRTEIAGYENTTFHDQIYSANLLQGIAGRRSMFQPYVKAGVGQLNRSATGSYANGASPPSIMDRLTGVLGGGLRVLLSPRIGWRTEVTSYLTGGNIQTYKNNVSFTTGLSLYF